ncbi:MAG: peroxiredoxin family protein [Chloroflexia bacterium]
MPKATIGRVFLLGWLILLLGCSTAGAARRGQEAPDFALPALTGETLRLSDFRGRPVLVNFWNSWCPPCRTEMPELQRVHEALGDRVVILAVNLLYPEDRPEDVRAFAQEQGLTFPILLDSDGRVTVDYRVASLPTSFFIDGRGKIIWFRSAR